VDGDARTAARASQSSSGWLDSRRSSGLNDVSPQAAMLE
jgi:hypothetical protein